MFLEETLEPQEFRQYLFVNKSHLKRPISIFLAVSTSPLDSI